jgi:hypothetical protein
MINIEGRKKMDYIMISEKRIPIIADVDVVVAGGGCAGVGAVISSAREGAKTILVERMFYLGGMMTGGLMSKVAISPTNNGLAKEILHRFDEYQGSTFLESRPEVPIDPEVGKLLFDRMVVEEAGAKVLFGTVVSNVVTEGRSIKAIIINSIEGEQAILAKYFIDCTGDGQLGFCSGASYIAGNEHGFCSSPTLMFRVGNCNIEELINEMEKHPEEYTCEYNTYSNHRLTPDENRQNIANDKYAHFADFVSLIKKKCAENPEMFTEHEMKILLNRGLIFMNQPQTDHVLVNSTRIPNFKGIDNQELSEAMIESRKQCECIFRFMKAFLPGFKNSYIMDTGSLLGIRESRRLLGDYVLTKEDVENLERFEDSICSNHGGVEIHRPDGVGTEIRELKLTDFYNIPYRSIISRDFDNLFMAGRCFSANHPALSAARNIAYCIALGEASGTASAQLVKSGKSNSRDVDIKSLQEKLKKNL